jgi:hypothetical protein
LPPCRRFWWKVMQEITRSTGSRVPLTANRTVSASTSRKRGVTCRVRNIGRPSIFRRVSSSSSSIDVANKSDCESPSYHLKFPVHSRELPRETSPMYQRVLGTWKKTEQWGSVSVSVV